VTLLYPQLTNGTARRIIADLLPLSPDYIHRNSRFSDSPHQEAVYSATGGARASNAQILSLIVAVTNCAAECDFPAPPSQANRLRFDWEASNIVLRRMQVSPAEASHEGVWNHLCCINLPHIVRWRFPEDKEERYLSGRRNTFERLWRRGYLLNDPDRSDEPLWMLKHLGEDEIVQLMERPQLHGRPVLARTTARLFLINQSGCPRRELFREMQKRLRRLAAVIEFDTLTDIERDETLADVIQQTALAISARMR
jgi:hypothetical protein